MQDAENSLDEFHEKHGFTNRRRLIYHGRGDELEQTPSDILHSVSSHVLAEALKHQKQKDERLYRIHLMVEELSEVCAAIEKYNEGELADGLADLMYVVVGTATTFDIPLMRLFAEVHRSNMSKQVRQKGNERMRDKGPSYSPPRIIEILADHFSRKPLSEAEESGGEGVT